MLFALGSSILVVLNPQYGRTSANPNTYDVRQDRKLYETRLGMPVVLSDKRATNVNFSPGGTQALIEYTWMQRKEPRKYLYVRDRGNFKSAVDFPGACRVGWIGEKSIICLHGGAEWPAGGEQFVSVYDARTLKKLWTKKLAARAEFASSSGSEAYIFVSRPPAGESIYHRLMTDIQYDVRPITAKGLGSSVMTVTSPAQTPDRNGFAAFCYRKVRSEEHATGYALEIDSRAKVFKKSGAGYKASSFYPAPRGRPQWPAPKGLESLMLAHVGGGGFPGSGHSSLYAFFVTDRKVQCKRVLEAVAGQFYIGEEFVVLGGIRSITLLPIFRSRDKAWYPKDIQRLGPVSVWSFPRS